MAELMEKHAQQIEALIKAKNEVMQQLTAAVQANRATPAPNPAQSHALVSAACVATILEARKLQRW